MSEARITPELRALVAERAQGCCEYCLSQVKFSPDPFSVEHIIPKAKGGSSDAKNLALSCQGCNNRKFTAIAATDTISGQTVPLYNPRQDKHQEHFAWNEDFTALIGLSKIGRATIERMQLNRPGVVNLREVLHQLGKHPPDC